MTRNLLSIDLEDWFCVSNFDDMLPRDVWDLCELRVEASTHRLLDLFDRRGAKATFFVLGWIAERAPKLIEAVAAAGHEVACHGYHHHRLGMLDAERFDADLGKALGVLRGITGRDIAGYRAPSFSLTKDTLWAVPVLQRHGFRYDSSVFPFGAHPEYGIADAPIDPYMIADGLLELPMTVVEVAGRRVPCTGGGYFRLYPYSLSRSLVSRCNESGRPAIFYAHPWEFDPEQPRLPLPALRRFRHYNNLDRTLSRLDRLLHDFEWQPLGTYVSEHLAAA